MRAIQNLWKVKRALIRTALPAGAAALILLAGACSDAPAPTGTAIDFEELSRFKPFTLTTVEGQSSSLTDHLGKATLVSFFFPT